MKPVAFTKMRSRFWLTMQWVLDKQTIYLHMEEVSKKALAIFGCRLYLTGMKSHSALRVVLSNEPDVGLSWIRLAGGVVWMRSHRIISHHCFMAIVALSCVLDEKKKKSASCSWKQSPHLILHLTPQSIMHLVNIQLCYVHGSMNGNVSLSFHWFTT